MNSVIGTQQCVSVYYYVHFSTPTNSIVDPLTHDKTKALGFNAIYKTERKRYISSHAVVLPT